MVIWETFKVAECRVFLLCTLHLWSSRIKRYITVVLWRNSCSLHQAVTHESNRLDRKTSCSRFFCKISSFFYSWQFLCLVFSVLLSLTKCNPFASIGGIFPLKCFHFPLTSERHVLLIILQQPQAWRRRTVMFFHAHRVCCAWKPLLWMWRDSKFFFPFSPLLDC